jgi:DNA-binding LacI/PurR family transcriptional regulator
MRLFVPTMTAPAPTPSNPVTLATIAAHLGVSRSTVSNAYNHPDQLSPQLRERIFETAAALGYNGPDPVARRLRQRHAGAIGILFSEPLHHAFADEASVLFLNGVATAGEQADSGLLLIPARPSEESAQVVQNAIVDGFILYSIPPGHPFVEAALRRRLPVVCVDQTRIGGVSWVGIDDRSAAREAAQHLVDLGHRKIAIMVYGLGPKHADTNEPASTEGPCPSVSWLRLEGYNDAMKAAGIDWNNVVISECEYNTSECGVEAARELLASNNGPTAILCTSDVLAVGALQAAKERNIAVPQQLSVVGFNDLPSAALTEPPLTTVRQPLVAKGREAAELLLAGTAAEDKNIHLAAELVIRESTGPALS